MMNVFRLAVILGLYAQCSVDVTFVTYD